MDKRTPLHLAAEEGHKSVVEILIRCRADIRAVDKVCSLMNIHVSTLLLLNVVYKCVEWTNCSTFGCH